RVRSTNSRTDVRKLSWSSSKSVRCIPRTYRPGPPAEAVPCDRPSVDADDCRVVEVPVALLHQLGVEVTDHLRDREPHTVVLPGLEDDLLVLELVAAGPAPAEVPAEVALALLPQRLRAREATAQHLQHRRQVQSPHPRQTDRLAER